MGQGLHAPGAGGKDCGGQDMKWRMRQVHVEKIGWARTEVVLAGRIRGPGS